jgi:hypothetical protein
MDTTPDDQRIFERFIPPAPQPFRAHISQTACDIFYNVIESHGVTDSEDVSGPEIAFLRDFANLSKADHPDDAQWGKDCPKIKQQNFWGLW